MTRARYTVHLRDDQCQQHGKITRARRSIARDITHVYVLMKSDAGLSDEQIADQLSINTQTVVRVRKRFVDGCYALTR
ncbi:helix-turn-helix domain-containing protein [Deinococcus navajonensis]